MNRTQIGRNIQCVGDNRNAAILYGINVNKTIIITFIINAVFVFIAAMLMLSRSTFATPGEGESYTLSAIVAAIIGGTSIQGGKGSIKGAFLGAFFVGCITFGLFRLSVNAWTGGIITGIVIIIVLSISSLNQKRKFDMERS
jgi:ribose transport system permease protein